MPVVRATLSTTALKQEAARFGLRLEGVPGLRVADGPDGVALVTVSPGDYGDAVRLMNALIRFDLAREL